jgi:hypothetical protein
MELEQISKLTKDVKQSVTALSSSDIRYLVDMYYQLQRYRISAKNQVRSQIDAGEPCEALEFFGSNFETLEKNMKSILETYAKSQEIGRWMLSICGIGPVIAAGLMAHIDIKKVHTAGAIQRFAGLDPTCEWNKGEKRPWNAKLKVLCWKIGQSFVKTSNRESDVYGHIYRIRKAYEQEKNEAGEYADQAAAKLKKYKIGKDTDAYQFYSRGMLPPGHIEQRAERYAVKIFLSHLFSVWYEMDRGEKPPKPYAIAILNHAHEIPIPNWPMAS